MANDYISREEVLKFVADIQECKYEPDKIFLYCQHLRRLPAADVAPVVHGQWIPARIVVDDYMGRWKKANQCSVCDGYFSKQFAYCPACGARMDKEAPHAD